MIGISVWIYFGSIFKYAFPVCEKKKNLLLCWIHFRTLEVGENALEVRGNRSPITNSLHLHWCRTSKSWILRVCHDCQNQGKVTCPQDLGKHGSQPRCSCLSHPDVRVAFTVQFNTHSGAKWNSYIVIELNLPTIIKIYRLSHVSVLTVKSLILVWISLSLLYQILPLAFHTWGCCSRLWAVNSLPCSEWIWQTLFGVHAGLALLDKSLLNTKLRDWLPWLLSQY